MPPQKTPSLTDQAAERAALQIREIKKLVHTFFEASEQQRRAAEAIASGLKSLSVAIPAGDPCIKEISKLLNRIQRIHELRNIAEPGAFSIEVNRTMELAWEKLCSL